MLRIRTALRLLAAASALVSRSAAADRFEIQVYDGTAYAPGAAAVEMHANVVGAGPRSLESGARDPGGEMHLTLEPQLGLSPMWEIGAYLQTALSPDGDYQFAGAKLRAKLVSPPGWRPHLRLGLNLEVAWLPATFDPDHWGSELRPIVAWEDERWLLAVNPILDFALTANGLGDGPSFDPAVAVKRRVGATPAWIGLEYYAGFGPITAPFGWSQQEQRVFETVDFAWGDFDFNMGFGQGLTSATDALVVKVIVGYAIAAGP